MYEAFQDRETVVIAIAQEDKDMASHGKFVDKFEGDLPFHIAADLDGTTLKQFERTSTYFIDIDGVVREVFPALIHMRPSWRAVLNRMDFFEEFSQ